MLTQEAYGVINGLLAIPSAIAKATAPLGIALLWVAAGSYELVLVAVLAGSILVVGSFWFAAAQREPNQQVGALHPKVKDHILN